MNIVLAYVLCIVGGAILGWAAVVAKIGPMSTAGFFGAILAAICMIVGAVGAVALGMSRGLI